MLKLTLTRPTSGEYYVTWDEDGDLFAIHVEVQGDKHMWWSEGFGGEFIESDDKTFPLSVQYLVKD